MPTVLITGGSGLIGQALTKLLVERNYSVIILTRKQIHNTDFNNKIAYANWDPENEIVNEEAIRKADYIIHLAGANIAEKRWTAKRKKEIVDSRVKSGELLVRYVKRFPQNIKGVISASAIGWYGADPQNPNIRPFTESDPAATDFLGITCNKWEHAISPVNDLGIRIVLIRTGIVLSNRGGAYPEFKKSIKLNLVPILGSGKQIISWIHINDLVRIYIEAIENENMKGAYNAVAPEPVSNKIIMTTIGSQLKKTVIPIHVPSILLKIILGEMSIEVLKSTTVRSEKLEKADFQFLYPTLKSAVENLNSQRSDQ